MQHKEFTINQRTVLILGGYGNAGLAITRLLIRYTKVRVILAGRNGTRAQRAAEQLNAAFQTECVTAAPAVACLLQYLDGSLQKPGLWRQATLVEPVRFFEDLARFGVQVKKERR